MNQLKTVLAVLGLLLLISGCAKDKYIPPALWLKSGAGFISADATVAKDTTIVIGVVAQKTEEDLKTFTVSYLYDAATTTTKDTTIALTGSEMNYYENTYLIHTRNQAGTEKWIFTLTDSDDNLTQKQLVLTVQ